MDEDRSHWPTKQQVAEALHITERTLEMKIQRGKIRASSREREGKKPWVILHPADVEALKQKPIVPTPTPKGEIAKRAHSEVVSSSKANSLAKAKNEKLDGAPRYLVATLTLKEAVTETGYPEYVLKQAMDDGLIPPSIIGRRYYFRWEDLVRFRPIGEKPKEKAKTKLTANFRNGITSQSHPLLEAQ